MLGVEKPGAVLSLNFFDILLRGKSIMGSLYGGLKPKSDIHTLIKWYTEKVTYYCFFAVNITYKFNCLSDFRIFDHQKLELDKFVTHEIGFGDINEAFDLLIEGKCLRCVIWMNK